jgi:1-acyl-sn-glycerol-3-phosphate acyltransferase
VYTDWLYLWVSKTHRLAPLLVLTPLQNIAYFADLADSITIILKASLKWIPFIGWGMQFFGFYFIDRSNSDEASLGKFLRGLGRAQNGKLLLLIFPEGTLVSKLTRPKSAAFAEKEGIEDLKNLLLPRSTGLWTCLRGLRDVEDLELVVSGQQRSSGVAVAERGPQQRTAASHTLPQDFTMGYPGIPPAGYGQSYYTLTSIFMQGVPPPAVHVHVRITPARELPLDDRAKFDAWVLQTWRDKDALLDGFYETGVFPVSEKGSVARAEVPIKLRGIRELGDICCWAAPIWLGWALYRLLR